MDIGLPKIVLFLIENAIIMLTFGVAALFIVNQYFDPKRRNLPPGPSGVPFLGYIPFFPADYGSKLMHLFAKYGKIFCMKLGSTDVVFISDVHVIKRIMIQDVYNFRPSSSVFTNFLPSALPSWNGEEWKEQRKFSLRVLRHLGVGKQEVEDAILDEIQELLLRLESLPSPVSVHRLLGSSVSNVVTLLVTGQRFDYKHPTRVLIDDCFLPRGNNARPSVFGYIGYVPGLSAVLRYLPFSPAADFRQRIAKVTGFMNERVALLKTNFDTKSGNVTCFIEAYLKEMAENEHGKYFDEKHLMGCALPFFAAGSNTVGDFLVWCLLYLMVHPVVQRKMRQEVDDVIGSMRVSTKYRDAMPFTEAVIQELHRAISVAPSVFMHAVAKDCQLEEYFLPKGTHIVVSSYAVHNNPEYFHQPEEFIPERFISKEGTFVRDERVIPFGSGKRSCPGEPIANTEVFLYLTSILQRFEVEMPKGKKYGTKGYMEFLGRNPVDSPIEVVFKKR